jgi:DNA repair protein RecO (recombination protein O)
MSEARRLNAQAAFVLHSQPYLETSLLLEVFSKQHGRVSMVARGARRPRSALRGVLLEFQPLMLDWFGKGEIKTLARAEWVGGLPLLRGEALLCGYYLNELLICLLPREDSHEGLYDAYRSALGVLASGGRLAAALRSFEKALLSELGYALSLSSDTRTGAPLLPDAQYVYEPERGPALLQVDAQRGEEVRSGGVVIAGQTLLNIEADVYPDAQTLTEAKLLMRMLINRQLADRSLRSRRVFKELLDL